MSITLIHGDCTLALLPGYNSVITDPPYSEFVHKNATSQSRGGGVRHRDLGFDCLSTELRGSIARMVARATKWSAVFSDTEGFHLWIEACKTVGATYVRGLPWCRFSMPSLCKWPPQGMELIGAFYGTAKGPKRWPGPGNHIAYTHKALRGEDKHKAEKPLDLMLELVTHFTLPGDIVLDPCAGSGTTGLACKLLGRDFVGYEIDETWALKAQERLARDTLSERDEERYRRWLESQETAKADAARRKNHTAKIRAKLDSQG